MAQLAIEVPDALLLELEQMQSQLPILLSQWAIAAKDMMLEITTQEIRVGSQ